MIEVKTKKFKESSLIQCYCGREWKFMCTLRKDEFGNHCKKRSVTTKSAYLLPLEPTQKIKNTSVQSTRCELLMEVPSPNPINPSQTAMLDTTANLNSWSNPAHPWIDHKVTSSIPRFNNLVQRLFRHHLIYNTLHPPIGEHRNLRIPN